jgi:DNA polymerase III subunit alpha
LIRAGAFDNLNDHRAQLLASVDVALNAAEAAQASAAQNSLFGDVVEAATALPLAQVERWIERTRLTQEKSALGYYFSGHLFDAYRKEVRKFAPRSLDRLEDSRDVQLLAGIAASVRVQIGKRGKVAYVMLDDGSAKVEVAVFSEVLERARAWLKEDELIVIAGKVRNDEYSGGLRVSAEEVWNLEEARVRFGKAIQITCISSISTTILKAVLSLHLKPSGLPLSVLGKVENSSYKLSFPSQWHINPSEAFYKDIAKIPDVKLVELQYS